MQVTLFVSGTAPAWLSQQGCPDWRVVSVDWPAEPDFVDVWPRLGGDGLDVMTPGFRADAQNLIRQAGVQLVFYPHPIPWAFEAGVPYGVMIESVKHRAMADFPAFSSLGRWTREEYAIRNNVRHAMAVLAASDAARQDLLHFYPKIADPGRIHVFENLSAIQRDFNGAGDLALEQARQQHHLPEKFLLCPASHQPHENLPRLLHAMERLRDENGIKIPLVMLSRKANGGQPWREIARKQADLLIRQFELSEQLIVAECAEPRDILAFCRLATAVVSPRLWGMVDEMIAGGWVAGCPVLAGDVHGVRERIGDAALLVNPLDSGELAQGIKKLLEDGDLRNRLAAAGRERLAALDLDRSAKTMAAILDKAAEPLRA